MRRATNSSDDLRAENPRKGANFLSVLSFWYTVKVFNQGRKKELTENDLTKPLEEHKSQYLGERLAKYWVREVDKAEEHRDEPSLTSAIAKCFLSEIFWYGVVLVVMEIGIRMFQPLFLGLLLRYFMPEELQPNEGISENQYHPTYLMRIPYYWSPQGPVSKSEACVFCSGVVLCSVLVVAIIHPILMGIMHVGMKIRVACCSLIYRKTLRISLVSVGGHTAGNVVNLMSNDVNRFDMGLLFLHYLWISPIQMFLSLYFMYREVGISAVIGIVAILAFIPLQVWFGNRTSVFRLKTALVTDERVRQMNEILTGMQVIKMYAWEFAFADLIHKMRKTEITVLRYTSYIRGMIMSFIMFTTRLAIFLTVMSYVLRGKNITAEKVFVITSYYQIIRQTMTVFFPQGIAQIAEVNVAIHRIKKFLVTEESDVGDPSPLDPKWKEKLNKRKHLAHSNTPLFGLESSHQMLQYSRRYSAHLPAVASTAATMEDKNTGVRIMHVSAKYEHTICLEDINLVIKRRQLTAIIGQVGSGKSCLLNLIMGELVPYAGRVKVNGVISYAAQEPWLFVASVRQNILFGRPYDRQRYNNVVKVCALVRDFSLLPYGDQTIVGERGISLSGGQRARINLARAVYKEADIYLLDDPLSAVDTHVGKQLFNQCISGYLANKVVVLVTHQLQHLQYVGQIIIMDQGAIEAKGTYAELQGSGLNFTQFLGSAVEEDHEDASKIDVILKRISRSSIASLSAVDKDGIKFKPQEAAEMRTTGAVGCDIYKSYFQAGGNWCVIAFMVSLFLLAQIFASGGDFFLSQWVSQEEIDFKNRRAIEVGNVGHEYYLSRQNAIIIYTVLIAITIFVALLRSMVFFTICMRASVTLHDRMFHSIITASMNFFHKNTSGRILNRFSKDLGAVDEFLPNAMIDCTQIMLNLVGVILIVTILNYYLIIPTVLICVMFYFLRNYYLMTSRSVKRLDGITRSPCFAHLNATIQGLPTIRSNGAEIILAEDFDRYQDIHSSAWYMFIATSRAFGCWSDLICALYIGIVGSSFLVFKSGGAEAGLVITQCIGLTGLFQWGMRQSAELENQMTSVERVLEFTRIEHEPPLESEKDRKPPKTWPSKGAIEFKNMVMRYDPKDPPVLKNLSLVIRPREKIGIVGRTGAGKSSLIAALFRLTFFDGKVIIDDIDTKQIGLHDLRKRISIIPQEPVLFSGTLRYNLDPFQEYNDAVMVRALIVVEIRAALTHGVACLDLHMSEGGINISVGERQMVCLARAILRDNVILVLDEATANVDPQTDGFIQKTIRTKFKHCTVLTIAHRLHTIMDSDKVLVMDAGISVEYDHPHRLLQKKTGFLSQMVNNTGDTMAENLRTIAKKSFDTRAQQSSK